jgi:PASTA domain-containing protein
MPYCRPISLHGRVVDRNHIGQSGLTVSAIDAQGHPRIFACTDERGYFKLEIPVQGVEQPRAAELFLQVSDKNKAILFRGEEAHVVTAGRVVYREIILGEQRQEPCPPPPEPETVRVPDLIGRMEAEAIETIQSAGLTVGQRQTQPAPNQVGRVLVQDPKAGTEVPIGTAVNLVIGVAEQVKVPKLVGMKLQSAREKIKESGLRLGSVTMRESRQVDVVLEQDPEAEKEVSIGTAVNLVVGQQRVEG